MGMRMMGKEKERGGPVDETRRRESWHAPSKAVQIRESALSRSGSAPVRAPPRVWDRWAFHWQVAHLFPPLRLVHHASAAAVSSTESQGLHCPCRSAMQSIWTRHG